MSDTEPAFDWHVVARDNFDRAEAAELERDDLRAKVARVEALADERDVLYPPKFAFAASDNYVRGALAERSRIRAALADPAPVEG